MVVGATRQKAARIRAAERDRQRAGGLIAIARRLLGHATNMQQQKNKHTRNVRRLKCMDSNTARGGQTAR